MKNTRYIAITAVGVALYVVLSATIRIPLVGHISVDLGFISLAVYAYYFGSVSACIVGGIGCTLSSLLFSGWFPLGWLLGNAFIGLVCGKAFKKEKNVWNIFVSVLSVVIGIIGIKTAVECYLYNIPLAVKIPKNSIAALTDSIVMAIGVIVARYLPMDKLKKV